MSAQNMRHMLEKRVALKGQLAAIDAAHPDTLPEAAQRQWDQLTGELGALEARITRQSVLNDVEGRIRGTAVAGGDNRWTELLSNYSLSRAVLYADATIDSALEREVSTELATRVGRKPRGIMVPHEIFMRPIEQRAGQMANVGTLGGFLVPERLRGDLLIDGLRAESVLPRLGVTYLDGLVGTTVIPKLTASGTVQWIAEGAEPDESEAAFGSISLNPRTAAVQMSLSRRTAINATPSIDALLRADIARQVAGAIDSAAIAGAGGAAPIGLLHAGIPVIPIATNGNPPTVENLIDLSAAPAIADASAAGPSWLTNNKVVAAAQKLKDGAGSYMFLNQLPRNLLGYNLVASSAVPSNLSKGSGTNLSAMIFGSWSAMLIGLWSGLDLLADPYTRGASGAVRLYAFQDLDVGIRHIESFAAFTDVKTT